jgi:hypothetical protein
MHDIKPIKEASQDFAADLAVPCAGLERERATLLAGAAVVKELKPLTGMAFAIVTWAVASGRLHDGNDQVPPVELF